MCLHQFLGSLHVIHKSMGIQILPIDHWQQVQMFLDVPDKGSLIWDCWMDYEWVVSRSRVRNWQKAQADTMWWCKGVCGIEGALGPSKRHQIQVYWTPYILAEWTRRMPQLNTAWNNSFSSYRDEDPEEVLALGHSSHKLPPKSPLPHCRWGYPYGYLSMTKDEDGALSPTHLGLQGLLLWE